MLRGAGKAAAVLALAASVLPCALLAGPETAVASTAAASANAATTKTATANATASQPNSPVTVSITRMSSRWASPGETVTVRGKLTNSSAKQIRDPVVDLLSSPTPIAGIAALEQYSIAGEINGLSPTFYSEGATWTDGSPLAPRSSVTWQVRLHVNKIGMSRFGVYPLVARAEDASSFDQANDYSYLPYEPAKHGAGASSRVTGRQIAWAWPVIDNPMLSEPFQSDCSGSQAKALAASLSPGGPLDNLLSVGNSGARGAGAPTSLASRDRVTWFIDPALLANVKAMAGCSSHPAEAKAATKWLAGLKKAIKEQPLVVTPYADVDVAALVKGHDGCDVRTAFRLGWNVANSVLHANVGTHEPSGCPASASPAGGFAWPAGGIGGSSVTAADTLESLRSNGISTVLSEGSAAQPTNTVVRVPVLGYTTVLLANPVLSQTLSKATSAGSSPFGSAQLFLAETAELAAASPHSPIIVAPPQRWQPSAGLAASLLGVTKQAPWLAPVSLSKAAAAKHVRQVQPGTVQTRQVPYSKARLRNFSTVDKKIKYIQGFQASPNPDLWTASATLESSAWNAPGGGAAYAAERSTVQRYISEQSGSRVEIVADPRVTLGGLKGPVPVSIYNKLGYNIRVRVNVQVLDPSTSGLHVPVTPSVIEVPAGKQHRFLLHVQATQVGTSFVRLSLSTANKQPLVGVRPVTMSIRATQFGTLAMIILAVALGLFLLASAARAVHRGRVTVHGDNAAPAEASGADAGPHPNEADNVSGERTELGAAGKPGL
jgi:Family of unknown function (DUF6049)